MDELLQKIRLCTLCEPELSLGARPVLSAHPDAKILIIGQAPGTKVHQSGIPWDDQSGKQLRRWMGIDEKIFYDERKISIVPMGFCYPGKGKTGDLPPRPECASLWHEKLLKKMPNISLTLLIGLYAQRYYLKNAKKTLTENLMHFECFLPQFLVMPHPSPRNRFWLSKNAWFETDVVPVLQARVRPLIK